MPSAIGASTGWWIGLVLGIVVIAVAAAIVITIVDAGAADRGPGAGRGRGRRGGARADRRARRHRADQRLRACGSCIRRARCERWRWANDDPRGLGQHALGDLARDRPRRRAGRRVPAVVLVRTVDDIDRSVGGLLEVAGKVGGQHRQHPAARGDGARAGADRRGGRGPGRLHERAHRRLRRTHERHRRARRPERPARRRRRRGARRRADRGPPRPRATSQDLATLAAALETVESEHLRPLEPAVKAINAQFDVILGALPGIAAKAAIVAERRPR